MKRHIAILSLVIPLAIAVYLNTLPNAFVFDDYNLIQKRQNLRSFSGALNLLGIGSGHMAYRPIRHLSYVLDYAVSGNRPWGYHLFNAVYHGLTCFILALLAQRLLGRTWMGLLAGLIFAVHPVQSESVAYASGRRDVLMSMFYFAALLSFVHYITRRKLIYFFITAAAWALALGTKEMSYTLPAMIGLIHWTWFAPEPREDIPSPRKELRALSLLLQRDWWIYALGFIAVTGMIIYKIFIDHPSRQEDYYGGNVSVNFMTVARILAYYLGLVFYPVRLCADYSTDAFPLSRSLIDPPFTVAAVLIVLILVALGAWLIFKRQFIGFVIMWFFITLTPVMHIFPHHDLMAEHFIYLPLFSLCLLLPWLIHEFAIERRFPKSAAGLLLIMLVVMIGHTLMRNRDWSNGIALYRATVKTAPRCMRAWANLGMEYQKDGQKQNETSYLRKALIGYDQALRIDPQVPPTLANRGQLKYMLGDVDGALADMEQALAAAPDKLGETHNNLGMIYQKKGRLDDAIKQFETALQYDRNKSNIHFQLGQALEKQGKIQQALPHYEKAAELEPEKPEARNALGMAYFKNGKLQEAAEQFREAIRLRPDYIESRTNLGAVLIQMGELEEAIGIYESLLEQNPQLTNIHQNMAVLYWKKYDCARARLHLEAAVKAGTSIPPSFAKAMDGRCPLLPAPEEAPDNSRQ